MARDSLDQWVCLQWNRLGYARGSRPRSRARYGRIVGVENAAMIPLVSAYLCEDCQCVGSSSVQCECGSKSLLCLAAVLNREIAILQFAESGKYDSAEV